MCVLSSKTMRSGLIFHVVYDSFSCVVCKRAASSVSLLALYDDSKRMTSPRLSGGKGEGKSLFVNTFRPPRLNAWHGNTKALYYVLVLGAYSLCSRCFAFRHTVSCADGFVVALPQCERVSQRTRPQVASWHNVKCQQQRIVSRVAPVSTI